ncbi:hypothetical protein CPC08DRAFT_754012, partial [Agrocybe pediades]
MLPPAATATSTVTSATITSPSTTFTSVTALLSQPSPPTIVIAVPASSTSEPASLGARTRAPPPPPASSRPESHQRPNDIEEGETERWERGGRGEEERWGKPTKDTEGDDGKAGSAKETGCSSPPLRATVITANYHRLPPLSYGNMKAGQFSRKRVERDSHKGEARNVERGSLVINAELGMPSAPGFRDSERRVFERGMLYSSCTGTKKDDRGDAADVNEECLSGSASRVPQTASGGQTMPMMNIGTR